MNAFETLCAELNAADVRYVVIGVWGANFFARDAGMTFKTFDRDLFLPLDADNELRAWDAAVQAGFELWSGDEPLGVPRDRWLAERIVERRTVVALTREDLRVDLSLVMADLDFETVWSDHRMFLAEGVAIPVARLSHIVESKRRVGRDKDLLFLATHEQALRDLLGEDDE
jgi:hypothetical protein